MSSNGSAPQPIPVSEMYDEVHSKWTFQLTENQVLLNQLEMKYLWGTVENLQKWIRHVIAHFDVQSVQYLRISQQLHL